MEIFGPPRSPAALTEHDTPDPDAPDAMLGAMLGAGPTAPDGGRSALRAPRVHAIAVP